MDLSLFRLTTMLKLAGLLALDLIGGSSALLQSKLVSESPNHKITNNGNEIVGKQTYLLLTTLFVDKCTSNNRTIYRTPIGNCYNGKLYAEGNNPFGDQDITDELVNENEYIIGISRSFYKSTNGTCTGGITDSFSIIPLDACVGPFGDPFPWGILKLIDTMKDKAIQPKI